MLPGTVKVAVAAAGICGSDLHEYVGGPISIPMTSPHPLTGERAPIVLGHELCGVVTEVGDDVDTVRVGERVTANAAIWCGACDACSKGWTNICRTVGFHGTTGGGGAFATYDVLPAACVHVVPDEVPNEVAVLVEPLATGFHAVDLADLRAGDSALVLGAGPVGLLLVQACVEVGVSTVVVVEPSTARRQLAAQLGATTCLDPISEPAVNHVLEVTGGVGVDAAFDAAAAPSSLSDAIGATRARGTVVNVAAWEKPVPFDPTTLLLRETVVRGSLAYTGHDIDTAIGYAARHVGELSRLVTRVIDLEDVVTDGFDVLAFTALQDVKVVVRP